MSKAIDNKIAIENLDRLKERLHKGNTGRFVDKVADSGGDLHYRNVSDAMVRAGKVTLAENFGGFDKISQGANEALELTAARMMAGTHPRIPDTEPVDGAMWSYVCRAVRNNNYTDTQVQTITDQTIDAMNKVLKVYGLEKTRVAAR